MKKLDYYKFYLLEKSLHRRSAFLKYKMDRKNVYNEFTYHNPWWWMDYKNFWIARFIEYNNLNKNKRKINFISVFWNRKVLKYIDWIKIFYTWEYIGKDRYSDYDDYCLNDVDLSIGFREYKWIDNYVRFPLWITYLFDPTKTSLEDIDNIVKSLEKTKLDLHKREKFCALISSHDDADKTRKKTFILLSRFWKVDCPWNLLHNIDANIPNYEDKIEFLKDYKYNICPENKEDVWYVTEKLIDSFKAWCIPIYRWKFGELENSLYLCAKKSINCQ